LTAVAVAGLGGAVAVAAAWEGLGALQAAAARRRLESVTAPLRAAFAGRQPTTAERRRLVALAALTLLAAGYLVAGLALALVLAATAPLALGQALRISRERWRADLGRGAPVAARAIADALSGGHSAPAAIALAAQAGAVSGAAGRELRSIAGMLALGSDQDAVLADLAKRANDPSWDATVTAIALQRRTGGDLAALLRRIADVADERDRVDADARTLTAQARFTARLVAAMPLAGLVLAELAVPAAVSETLSEPLGLGLLVMAAAILVAALAVISRLARPLR
jgi:tight adherence protein B